MSLRILPVAALFVLVACGGAPTTPNPPPEGTGGPVEDPIPPKTDEEQKADEEAKTDEEKTKPETAPKLDKPKSESTIGGASISEIDGVGLEEAVKKLGWAKEGNAVGSLTVGSYESLNYQIEKGKLKGKIEIVRPAASPGEVSSANSTPPAEQKEAKEKEGSAVFYDEASDVLVAVTMIEGKPADAKGILGKLVKKSKKKK